ncbi:FG-GAP repeat domain-containing protein [Thermodesulfobacteriota bacterium]
MKRIKAWGRFLTIAAALLGMNAIVACPPHPTFEYNVLDMDNEGRVAIGDVDGDGKNDIVVHSWYTDISWYRYPDWDKSVIAANGNIRGDEIIFADLDEDGDLDLVGSYDNSGKNVYWFENPRPGGDPAAGLWEGHFVGTGYDELKGVHVDYFDEDDMLDIAVRHHAKVYVYFQDSPMEWTQKTIDTREREGMDIGDIDSDGDTDIVMNGFWLENPGDRTSDWSEYSIDEMWYSGQPYGWQKDSCKVQVRDMNKDGKMDVTFSHSEAPDEPWPVAWYETDDPKGGDSAWTRHDIGSLSNCHTLQVTDLDNDGDYDVVAGRLRDSAVLPLYFYYNEGGALTWDPVQVSEMGCYSGIVGDIDSDGDMDFISSKRWDEGPVYFWRNTMYSATNPTIDQWERYLVDGSLPSMALFVMADDLDGDGRKDLVAGGWWWKNPGSLDGDWGAGRTIGSPLSSAAAVDDFDNDGDLDIFGSQGTGADNNNDLAWARNDGTGNFTVLTNIETGGWGDFLQGVLMADLGAGEQIVMSWHNGGGGIQVVSIPENPSTTTWPTGILSPTNQGEDISADDIDRDGDQDLLLGTMWLRNDAGSWSSYTIGSVQSGAEPDRNDLADINGDGRLDAVVALEGGEEVYWFEAPPDATGSWQRYLIGSVAGEGFSMDVADFDGDGDPDVVLGEHKGTAENRVIIFENVNGGSSWNTHVIDSGPVGDIDHHDGTQAVDLDGDGDLDLISIGYTNAKVWIFENKAID